MSKIIPKTKTLKILHYLSQSDRAMSLLKTFVHHVWNDWACFSWMFEGLFFHELASEHNGSLSLVLAS